MKGSVPFAEYARVYLPLYIKPSYGATMLPIDLKVDTGADYCTISKDDLYYLGYGAKWVKENMSDDVGIATTASGEILSSYIVRIPVLNIFGYEAMNWPFRILLDDVRDGCTIKRNYRNLLGRDLLAGFNFTFNNRDKYFEWEKLDGFEALYSLLPGQQIHDLEVQGNSINKMNIF